MGDTGNTHSKMSDYKVNFLLAGVGGQGTLLASDIVAEVGLKLGLDAKKSEVHGMSQRGGAVTSHVRWGRMVASPLCEKGTVDYFIAQEMLEALRWLDFLRPGATVILSQQKLPPVATVFGNAVYPSEDQVLSAIGDAVYSDNGGKILSLDAVAVAEEVGNRRTANSVLLGALAAQLGGGAAGAGEDDPWLEVIMARVPARHKEVNRVAFLAGHEGKWELVR